MRLYTSESKSDLSDLEIVERFKVSEDLSLTVLLFNRYVHLVFGLCLKYLKNHEDCNDAVMEVFEKLPQSLLDHEIKNFSSWLYVTAKNHCLMKLRTQKKHSTGENDFGKYNMDLSYSMHHNDAEDKELSLRTLEKALPQLPLEQNRCIELFYLKEKCYKEIVSITGYDLKQIKSYIQNGKRNLKIILEKES